MHERSNSTCWEIYIRRQRDFVKVRMFEKVNKCYSLDSHANRNRNYEMLQTDSYLYPSQCIMREAFSSAAPWRGVLGQRINGLKRQRFVLRGLILQTGRNDFSCTRQGSVQLCWGIAFTSTFARSGP